jgi:hypothetical protein
MEIAPIGSDEQGYLVIAGAIDEPIMGKRKALDTIQRIDGFLTRRLE